MGRGQAHGPGPMGPGLQAGGRAAQRQVVDPDGNAWVLGTLFLGFEPDGTSPRRIPDKSLMNPKKP